MSTETLPETRKLRAELLLAHCAMVRQLTSVMLPAHLDDIAAALRSA